MSGERVFPPTAAPQPATPSAGSGKSVSLSQKQLLMGGGVIAVVMLGLLNRSPGGEDTETDPETPGGYELDTRDTDLYNELQPELERIGDAIENWTRPPKPAPAQPGKPGRPNGGPRPLPPGIRRRYRVKRGDTLAKIAKTYKVVGGRARLYATNRAVIERAAKQHGRKSSGGGRYIYAGTVLLIPGGNRHGVR